MNEVIWIMHQPYQHPEVEQWSQQLVSSYRRLLGRDLVQADGSAVAAALFQAPAVVVSHGTEADPIFNYANRCALTLWELDWAAFTRLPSRLSAEPLHRDERSRMLEQLNTQGFIDNYRGVRISSQGRRFYIEQAIVWNVMDDTGRRLGQAATFEHWTFLDT